MLRHSGFATRNQLTLCARKLLHALLLLSLLLGYAPAPLLAAPPEPLEPEIAEPAGIDAANADSEAGVAAFVENPPVEPEPAVPLTYEEIEAAGRLQVLPAELPAPEVVEQETEQAATELPTDLSNGLYLPLITGQVGEEEAAIVEIGEDLPDAAFALSEDEAWDDVPELAADAFAEENNAEYKKPSPSPSVSGSTGWSVYRDQRYGYGLAVADTWTVLPTPEQGQMAAAAIQNYTPPENVPYWLTPDGAFKLNLVVATLNAGQTALSWWEQNSTAAGTSITSMEPTLIGSANGWHSIVHDKQTDIASTALLVQLNNRELLIVSVYPEIAWLLPDIQTALSSFEATSDTQIRLPSTKPVAGSIQPPDSLTIAQTDVIHPCGYGSEVPLSPISLHMPFSPGTTWTVGGSGSYYSDGMHTTGNNDYYATDWNMGSGDADNGQPVYPVASGTVAAAYWDTSGYGNTILIEHDGNPRIRTRYAHLSAMSVSVGQRVELNVQIGTVGNTGGDYSSHLHLSFQAEVDGRWQSKYGIGRRPSPMQTAGGSWDHCDGQAATVADKGSNPPPPNCGNYSYNGVVLFENKECNGDKREYGNPTGVENLPSAGWNDRASSVYIASNWSVRVWSDSDTGGATRCLSWSMWDLSQDNYDGSDLKMDETISSIKVFNNGNCTDSTPSPRAKLFSEPNQRGSVVWEGGVGFSNDPNANSYSLELPGGWSAITYRGDNRGEPKHCWSGSVANFQDTEDWQNKTQSIDVYDSDVCPKPPAAPSGLYVSGVNMTSVTLGWQDNSGDETNFNIYRWNGSDYAYIASAGANATSYTDGDLSCGGNYSYKVRAVNGAGESAMTDPVTASTTACPAPGIPTLTSPANGASFVEGEEILFAWNAAVNGDEYLGEVTGGPSPFTFGWLASTSYRASPPAAGYQYTWHVKTGFLEYESDWSEARTFSVRPAAPANVTATSPSCGKVTVTWSDRSANEEGYRIYRDGQSMGSVGAGVTSFTQDSMPAGAYTYRVRAYRGSFASDAGNDAPVTVAGCPPPAKLTTTVTPATQAHNGVARIATRFTLRETAGAAVQIRSYTSRWYSANGTVALAAASNPVTLTRNIAAGSFITWSVGLLLPRSIAEQAADRGESAVRLYMTFRGIDSMGRAASTSTYVTLKLSACGDATEPNNGASSAKAIAYGQTQTAVICPSGELDLFTFNGTTGDRIRIAARPREGSAPLNPKLELLGSDGRTVLATNDNRTAGQLDARIALVLPATGKYYLRVTDAGRLGGVSQSYNLLLHQDSGKPAVAIRPFPTGDWLHARQQTIRVDASDRETEVERVQFFVKPPGATKWQLIGTDMTAGDGWWFYWDTSKLPAAQGYAIYAYAIDGAGNGQGAGVYGLDLERTPPTVKATTRATYGDAPFRAFGVRWYGGSDGDSNGGSNSGSNGGSGIASYDIQVRRGTTGAWTDWITQTTSLQARYVGTIDQTYYFRARARDKTGTVGAYAGGSGDANYKVTVCPVAADSYEADGSAATAFTAASNGSRYEHNFHVEGDQDWIALQATAGVTYTVQTETLGAHADTVLTLYGGDGQTVLAQNDDAEDSVLYSRLIWPAQSRGTYYVQVTHHDRYGYGCTTNYALTITQTAEPRDNLPDPTPTPEPTPDPTPEQANRLLLPFLRR